eukprot:CAMPEP_0202908558 /NCGR_PEP_ID=MMETSP1392-20130828/46474_1 /ASSEMBLY_ACC=CAM_ASM_000868 /TAXON_ID=225041 /ORGANISM="Chlamydomonas chlamydogama, Strain SAG 11-48b" /LENGTH=180 /DNA_ID=CAMNT_0049597957 /DNA_START=179 /DNA_END=721 /DNA_ORIENTATION=-
MIAAHRQRGRVVARHQPQGHSNESSILSEMEEMYELALAHARANNWDIARSKFQQLVSKYPTACRGWVSWAQMEKRYPSTDRFDRCRQVLQRGLEQNTNSACLIQAWGLMELQRGNLLAALMMLERAVKLEPSCSPVLKWRQVDTARKTVGSRRSVRRGTSIQASSMASGSGAVPPGISR